ncbi:MAG: diacylglycerol kinase family protein [Eubacteriales bacterium]|nr:diacylglycerol kinase family protein [Eubacteriales bacterium]
MDKKTHTLKESFRYAISGIYFAFREERNFKVHSILAILAIFLATILQCNLTEWIIIILCIGIVMSAEIFNTAIENTMDWLDPQYNKYVKKVKDLAAGGVLVVSIAVAIVGLLIFVPKVIHFFKL